jgi:hypothetical protein
MGALVQSGSGPSRSDPRQAQASSMPVEVLRAMREAGAVKALAQALNLVSTEHPQVRCTAAAAPQLWFGVRGCKLHTCQL